MNTRILVVDDDPTVSEVVARYLERDGHEVECVGDGAEALRRALANPPDLMVLDLMLPKIDGLQVCRKLRERWPVPVIMLTALGEETDRVVGLEVGADDYVTKPFSPRELALRVDSVLRRTVTPAAPRRSTGAPAGAGEAPECVTPPWEPGDVNRAPGARRHPDGAPVNAAGHRPRR